MKTVKTKRLKYFEDNCLLGTPLVCLATYIKNGNANQDTDKTVLLENITICNTSIKVDHLWVKDHKKVCATKVWKSNQQQVVYFIAKFIKITKAGTLYETKEDLSMKIVKILK